MLRRDKFRPRLPHSLRGVPRGAVSPGTGIPGVGRFRAVAWVSSANAATRTRRRTRTNNGRA